MTKRQIIKAAGAAAVASAFASRGVLASRHHDLLIIGAGTAGIPAAIFAAARGASVLVIDVAPIIGGTLTMATGQISAAGTRIQKQLGIEDSADLHFEDLMRISRGTIDQPLVRVAVDNAADTVDWLFDHGYEILPGYPVRGIAHEPYSRRRYYWSASQGMGILDAMRPQFMQQVAAGRIDLVLEHRAVALQTGASGDIAAVVTEDSGGQRRDWRARQVLLASGGYASNAAMFENYAGKPKYLDYSYPFARGDGQLLAESVGGYMRYAEKYLSSFGYVLTTSTFPSARRARTLFDPEQRQPWEIYVNSQGQRFVREDLPSVDGREQALRFQPGLTHWVVFDQGVLDSAPPLLEGWSRDELGRAFAKPDANFFRGDSVAELAAAAGLPAKELAATIEGYNYGVTTGADFLGRRHLPMQLGKPPFYAIQHFGTSVTSTAGIAVNDRLQVVRRDGTAIANLFAAGEILGAGATQGQAFCGGMMITPALTFGRLLGGRIIPLG